MGGKTIARMGLLAAVMLVLGYLDSVLPIAPGIPGIKLGLANTVLLYGIYTEKKGGGWLLLPIKILLAGLLFSGVFGMVFSLVGGALSMAAMLLLKRFSGLSVIGVSVGGAVFHNIGQILVACFMVQSRALLGYLPLLLLSAVLTGLLTGLIARLVLKALGKGRLV